MSTLKELLAARTKLERDLAETRQKAAAEGLTTIHDLIKEFGFTAQQVFPWRAPETKKIVAKYLEEKTGATWSGRGKPPKWIVGKNYDDFLIRREQKSTEPSLAELAAAAGNWD